MNRAKMIVILGVIALLILGLGLRFIKLTDPPLEAGYRQLHAAIIARGMYYQMLPSADPALRQTAIILWHAEDIFELPIFERLVSVAYLITGGEKLWIPRIFSIVFWMIGGLGLFSLGRKMTTSMGALVSLAFYLVLPFGVVLSRRFQPDPFMVMWVILAALALYVWEEKRDLKYCIVAGLACGIAVVIKVFAVFFIAPMALAMVLISGSLKSTLRNFQIWIMAGIMITIPTVVYFVFRSSPSGYFTFWTGSFLGMLSQPSFYVRWWELASNYVGGLAMIIGLAGIVIAQRKARAILIALWLGYVIFGLFEPWQISTHDYYSLILVPIVAISLAPIAALFFERLDQQPKIWKFVSVGLALFALAIPMWYARIELVRQDSHINWLAWTRIGEALPKDGQMIALTNDYGTYAEYFGWRQVSLWPTSQDYSLIEARGGNTEPDFHKNFSQLTQGVDYFLIIAFNELDDQPMLKKYLYDHFPYSSGDGYTLFYLKSAPSTP